MYAGIKNHFDLRTFNSPIPKGSIVIKTIVEITPYKGIHKALLFVFLPGILALAVFFPEAIKICIFFIIIIGIGFLVSRIRYLIDIDAQEQIIIKKLVSPFNWVIKKQQYQSLDSLIVEKRNVINHDSADKTIPAYDFYIEFNDGPGRNGRFYLKVARPKNGNAENIIKNIDEMRTEGKRIADLVKVPYEEILDSK